MFDSHLTSTTKPKASIHCSLFQVQKQRNFWIIMEMRTPHFLTITITILQSHAFILIFARSFPSSFFRLRAIALPRDRSALVPCLLSHLTFGNGKVISKTYNPALDIIVYTDENIEKWNDGTNNDSNNITLFVC